jgi:septum formation protein
MLWLASASPRRRELLAEAGIDALVMPPDLDDANLSPGPPGRVKPEHWAMAMAFLKARRVALQLLDRGGCQPGLILGADTICALGQRVLGKPRDAAHARDMLRSLRNAVHRTLTGVCLLHVPEGARRLWVDSAEVIFGPLSDQQTDSYVASGEWRGKAGAYNLQERIDAGWPIECRGDPTTVMGLPMRQLRRCLVHGSCT